MSKRGWPPLARIQRGFVGCVLVVATSLYGVSGLLVGLLGAAHYHRPVGVASVGVGSMQGWQDFRRTDHVSASTFHVHDHSTLGRHHHDASDPTVVTVGADEHDETMDRIGASAAGLTLLAIVATMLFPAVSSFRTPMRWAMPAACAFQSCDLRRIDRPPIA